MSAGESLKKGLPLPAERNSERGYLSGGRGGTSQLAAGRSSYDEWGAYIVEVVCDNTPLV